MMSECFLAIEIHEQCMQPGIEPSSLVPGLAAHYYRTSFSAGFAPCKTLWAANSHLEGGALVRLKKPVMSNISSSARMFLYERGCNSSWFADNNIE